MNKAINQVDLPVNGDICIDNIGPLERKRRARFGFMTLGFGMGLAAGMIVMGFEWYWRLGLYIIFAPAMIGFFQARERT